MLEQARADYAYVANAIADFEPVTMIAGSAQDARAARSACAGRVEIVELPIDDSWLRDSGPIYVVDGPQGQSGSRLAVHFGFNAWGEKFSPWDRDAAIGGLIASELGDDVQTAPLVLEGGSVISDGAGTILTTEQCLLSKNRNPTLSQGAIEELLGEYLGAERIVWLGQGLVEDRDTDGHVDLIAAFTPERQVLAQGVDGHNLNAANVAENLERLAVQARRRRAGGGELPELLHLQRCRDRAGQRARVRRRGAGDHRLGLPRARGGARAGSDDRLRRRRPALHHPAGAECLSTSSSSPTRFRSHSRGRATRAASR
jgi:agmatine/peptidylarginine deiminase